MTKNKLKNALAKYGSISSLYIAKERETGLQKGYAFFKVDSLITANRLVNTSLKIDGRTLFSQIKLPKNDTQVIKVEQNRVFVKGINISTTNSELHDHFSQYGEVKIVSKLYDKKKKKYRKIAFIDFMSEEGVKKSTCTPISTLKGSLITTTRYDRKMKPFNSFRSQIEENSKRVLKSSCLSSLTLKKSSSHSQPLGSSSTILKQEDSNQESTDQRSNLVCQLMAFFNDPKIFQTLQYKMSSNALKKVLKHSSNILESKDNMRFNRKR